MSLERVTLNTIGAGAGLVGAYKLTGALYERQRRRNLPENGTTQSTLPFYETLVDSCEEFGIIAASAGGIVKQALGDPYTEYDLDNRSFIVSRHPGSTTLKKATLYRPDPELNLRDLDVRLLAIIDDGTERPATAEMKETASMLTEDIQQRLDETAARLGFPRGPELSLFTYDREFDHDFRPTDYATRTILSEDGSTETLFDNNGNSVGIPVDPLWHCVVPTDDGEIHIPTNSPQTILGRTFTRPVVMRVRDASDVKRALSVIQRKGLSEELLPNWDSYFDFRNKLDSSITLKQASERLQSGKLSAALNTLAALAVIPLAESVEKSYIGMAIRDPDSPIYSTMARIMGASE